MPDDDFERPLGEFGGERPVTTKRQLRFYWLLDTSGSMSKDGKIQTLNNALRESTEIIRKAAAEEAKGDLIIYAVQFNSDASWVSGAFGNGVPGTAFEWPEDLQADGETYVGKAIELVADSLKTMPNNAYKPVLVLVTDGQPSDDFKTAMKKLLDVGWGRNAFRIAIGIGDDADLNVCAQFCSDEISPLKADTMPALKRYIRWASQIKDPTKQPAAPVVPLENISATPTPAANVVTPVTDDTF